MQDGYISFTVDRMGSYAILGFAEEGQTKPKNDIPVPLLIIIIVGVLLLVAAGLLLFFFVLRRPRDPDDDLPPDDDLFSGDDWPTGGGLTMLTDAPSPGDFSPDGQPGDVPGDTLPLVPLSGDGQPAVPLKPTAPSTPVQPEEKTGRNAPVDGNDRDISTVRTASVPPLPPPMFPSAPLRSRKGRERRIPATTISTCRHGTAFGKPASASSAPVTVGQPAYPLGSAGCLF